MNSWLMSVHPRFATAIFGGEKTVELRRRRLHASPGDILFIYETSPVMAIRGVVRVVHVETRGVDELWRLAGDKAAIERSEYARYFVGVDRATAIHLDSPFAFVNALSLSTIRRHSPLFHPPRTWACLHGLPLPLQVKLRDFGHLAASSHQRAEAGEA
jgi:predicted transcriptional regulator